MKRDADFAGFLGETFAVARDALPWMAGYIAILTLLNSLPALLFGIATSEYSISWGFKIDANVMEAGALAVLLVIVLGIVTFLIQYLFFAHLLAHRGYSIGRNRFLGYLGFSILYGLGLLFGFLLLVIPGLILLVRWIAATGYVVGTETPVPEAFGKSWEATRGHGWPLFFAMIVLGIATAIAVAVLVLPVVAMVGDESVIAIVAEVLGQNIYGAMFLAFGAAVFYLLNDDTEAVREVFD
ncbi:hypothetical protein [Erythrobacter litoralis]|uniref:Glycerophosphoryl diester phosphodiesterase membrane domain-containing protein n=1 Tax=Erythrobacter litoralis (strain HTCC2594) TaxID=314225 RepID=Q2NB88_ERYLH|nr:hypothetical protein [Erythrobacter litoralis]ABC63053.1 hypothetical protein ELI_04805 [Erythrobacter litoralis HTCC2594]